MGTECIGDLEQRASSGDQAALTALLERVGPTVREDFRGQIPARWQSMLSLDDLMQETYTDAFLGFSDFRPQGNDAFLRWLKTIAKHNLLNAIRDLEAEKRGGARRRIDSANLDDSFVALHEILGGTTTTPSRHAVRTEIRAAIDQAIDQLPPDHQLVVRMYDIEGHPVEDVAVAMKRSSGAVFMLRARAHRELQHLLGAPVSYFSDSA